MRYRDFDPDEDVKRRNMPFREMAARLLPRFNPFRGSVALGFLLLLIGGAAELAGPILLKELLEIALAAGADARAGIAMLAAAFAGVHVLASTCNYFQVVVLAKMGLRIVTRLKEDLFNHLTKMDMSFFDAHPPGTLMARVESDCQRLVQLFSEVAVALLRNMLVLIGILAVLFYHHWIPTTAALIALLPMIIGVPFALSFIRRQHGRVRQLYAQMSTFLGEYLKTVPVLQVFNYTRGAADQLKIINRKKLLVETRVSIVEYGFFGLFLAFETLALIAVFYVGSSERFGTKLSIPTLVLFIELIRRMFQPILQFSEQLAFIQRAFASADRVLVLLDHPLPRTLVDAPETTIPADWTHIAFEDVTFAYDGQDGLALNNISFTIARGERLALVGLSGGGKTTITRLLMRFYTPTSGRITIDGRDVRNYDLTAWRRNLGLVLQDIHLFPGTVADNLRVLDDDIPDEALRRALTTVTADALVERIPGGLDGPLSEDGANLSMGERQLLSFARALVRNPDILLLDEATASVDPATERRIDASMRRMLSGRTAIIVAHRLSTVMHADRILVIHHGHLVQEGDHATLHAVDGIYRDLFRLQFGGTEALN